MSPAEHALDAGTRGFVQGLAVDLAAVLRHAEPGDTLALQSHHPLLDPSLNAWATLLGHAIVEKTPLPGGGFRYLFRLGGHPDVTQEDEAPAERVWIYTNLHCNLACDYCCVRSSPKADPAMLSLESIRRMAAEAPELGLRRIILTGGEPFLRADLDQVVAACAEHLPTTLLTNGMLFDGPRRVLLERMPRNRVTLQVSLDSPTAELHDAHRGTGSWERARAGIAIARELGFRVRVAATTHTAEAANAMLRFLEQEGIEPHDRLVRPVAKLGEAEEGIPLLRRDVQAEVTLCADGVYWHPVGAVEPEFRVRAPVTSLADAVAAIRALEARDAQDGHHLPAVFHCT